MVNVDPVTQTPTEAAAYPSMQPDAAPATDEASSFDVGSRPQFEAVGSSGTQIFGGYFAEEYLNILRGKRGAKIYEEMLRSEPQIAMINSSICNPIKSANWDFQPDQMVPNGQLHADLVKTIVTEMLDWETALHEILTFLRNGYSVFEVVHNVIFNHPKFGTFNGIKALAFRTQKTIERWNLEPVTGTLIDLEQYVYSDIGTNATIPGQFVVVFTLQKEGDNYEGISLLRPMYGPWLRKNLYLKLAAIGVEKSAIGTVVGTTPKGKLDKDEQDNFKKILGSFVSHETAYIMKPEGWLVEILYNDFDPAKLKELIVQENTEMANAAVANFLALGMSGTGGAYALGTDLSDFFLSGIQNFADLICGVFNRKIIPDLIKLNFGEQQAYPKMVCSGINDKAGKELADIVKSMVDGKVWTADDKLEEFTRKEFKMPPADPLTARVPPPVMPGIPGVPGAAPTPPGIPPVAPPLPPMTPAQLSEKRIQLAEKFVSQFDKNASDLKALMQDNLATIYARFKDDIRKQYKNTSPSDRIKLGSKLEAPGISGYKSQLRDALAKIASDALDGATKEARSNVKLAERIRLAAPRGGYYNSLPPQVRKIVDAQSNLIGDSQAADLEKIVTFGYTSGAAAYDTIDPILNGIDEDALNYIDGGTKSGFNLTAAAGNTVANVTNQARMDFFFEPDVLDTIESFTFTNEAPVSEICQSLADTTVAPDAPELSTYATPLHHNCKSRWVPNMKGDSGNPDIERGGISVSQKALDSITLCEFTCRH